MGDCLGGGGVRYGSVISACVGPQLFVLAGEEDIPPLFFLLSSLASNCGQLNCNFFLLLSWNPWTTQKGLLGCTS